MVVHLKVSTEYFLLVCETSRAVSKVCFCSNTRRFDSSVFSTSGQRRISRGRVGGIQNATCEISIFLLHVMGGVCNLSINFMPQKA